VFVNRRGIAKEGYQTTPKGETAKWVSKYGSVTFNLVGRELPWAGINESGVVMSSMQLLASKCPEPDERPPVGEAYLVQYVLDTCSNVEEAIEAVKLVRLPPHECATHFMVADKTGGCAAIEFLEGDLVYHTGETLPYRAMANAPYQAGVAFIEEGIIPEDNPGRSVERVAGAVERMEAFDPDQGTSPVDYSFSTLAETVVDAKEWWSDMFNDPYTRWNIVFEIAKGEVHFRTVESPAVKHISLSSFDFSCEAPPLMLDINTELEGSIEGAFGPYDHDANLKIFRSFCDMWGIEVTEESSAELIRLFESFECSDREGI
jgi:penicillin V acylase-like amidase (Ntn superfamily)